MSVAKKYTIRAGFFVTCPTCQKVYAAEKFVSVSIALRMHTKKRHPIVEAV